MRALREVVRRNRAGEPAALASVCSAHPDVLEASMRLCAEAGRPALVEATSNQVNQDGGYTGLDPAAFRSVAEGIADRAGLDRAGLLLGGDHLGPQAWRRERAEVAMDRAETMLRSYVGAGFRKIHLDCSEGCAGEPAQVGDALAAERAARLAAVCEAAAPDPAALSYVVGTEVPPPGGARAGEAAGVAPTDPDAARATLAAHEAAFAGTPDAWARVAALVVQPGLEFGPDHVDRFDDRAPDRLSAVLDGHPGVAFEAHSTDFQHGPVFAALVRRRFGVLKVGPALSFAWREAVYGLDHVRRWRDPGAAALPTAMEALMTAEPDAWRGHYDGDADRRRILRHFGYADRIRYYWARPEARDAVAALDAALAEASPPEPLLRQYLPATVLDRAEPLRVAGASPLRAVAMAAVQVALVPYLAASEA